MNINLIEKLYKTKYYVYEHYLDDKLFYIGKGTEKRALDYLNRSELWKAKVDKREADVKIKIIAHFYDNLYAEAFEKMHIQNKIEEGQDLINIMYNKNFNGDFVSYQDFRDSFKLSNVEPNLKYKSHIVNKINNVAQLEFSFIEFKKQYLNKAKGLVYTNNIDSIKTIEAMLKNQGFNPLTIWSTYNEQNLLTKKQIIARYELIRNGKIPEPYDFLVFNNSLFNQLNLKDDSIEFVAINTKSEKIQQYIRALVKKDIHMLTCRVAREKEVDLIIDLPKMYINKWLTSNIKDELCFQLNIINASGKVSKWGAVNKLLLAQNYEIKNSVKTIDGKRTRVSKITYKQTNVIQFKRYRI